MITVKFDEDREHNRIVLHVKGHAGQNDVGKDIICSASSILAYTVAQYVKDMYKCKKLCKKPVITLTEGLATIIARPKEDFYDEAIHTYLVAMTGYNLLAHNYSEYVSLKQFGEE